jgi:hypothetical protein
MSAHEALDRARPRRVGQTAPPGGVPRRGLVPSSGTGRCYSSPAAGRLRHQHRRRLAGRGCPGERGPAGRVRRIVLAASLRAASSTGHSGCCCRRRPRFSLLSAKVVVALVAVTAAGGVASLAGTGEAMLAGWQPTAGQAAEFSKTLGLVPGLLLHRVHRAGRDRWPLDRGGHAGRPAALSR